MHWQLQCKTPERDMHVYRFDFVCNRCHALPFALLCCAACPLQIQGLPTLIFIGMDNEKPALRTEGLLPAETIKNIITKEL